MYEGGLALEGVGGILQGLSSLSAASAEKAAGKMAYKGGKRKAKQIQADYGRAASAEQKRGEKLKSDATAQMAASGGGVDPASLADIDQATEYNVLAALYEGDILAADERMAADIGKFESGTKQSALKMKAATSIFDGVGGLKEEWDRYKSRRMQIDDDEMITGLPNSYIDNSTMVG